MSDQFSSEQIDTVVIGAGQAGLSAGHHLAKRGLPFVILDADARIGDHWRDRWDSLKLYSPARFDSLPGRTFPAPSFHYPTGREMGDYLETYARWFELPVQSGQRVERVDPATNGGFVVTVAGGRQILARQVISATGAFRTPHVPSIASELDPSIRQMHSHDYQRPDQLQPGPVLVVGLSHSGADVAIDTARAGHQTLISGKAHAQVPVAFIDRPMGRVVWPIMKFVFFHLATIRTPIGRRMKPEIRNGGGPLLRYRLPDLDAAGVVRHDAKTVGVADGKPMLADGTVLDVANVVWCTGYRPDYSFINAPIIGPDGWPEEVRGVSPAVPGLFFVGVPFQYGFSSMLIGGAGRDAKYVVDRIAERVAELGRGRELTPAPAR